MKRIQDFWVIIQRLNIVQPVLLTGKKLLARTEDSVALILLRVGVLLQQTLQDQKEALTVKEN